MKSRSHNIINLWPKNKWNMKYIPRHSFYNVISNWQLIVLIIIWSFLMNLYFKWVEIIYEHLYLIQSEKSWFHSNEHLYFSEIKVNISSRMSVFLNMSVSITYSVHLFIVFRFFLQIHWLCTKIWKHISCVICYIQALSNS